MCSQSISYGRPEILAAFCFIIASLVIAGCGQQDDRRSSEVLDTSLVQSTANTLTCQLIYHGDSIVPQGDAEVAREAQALLKALFAKTDLEVFKFPENHTVAAEGQIFIRDTAKPGDELWVAWYEGLRVISFDGKHAWKLTPDENKLVENFFRKKTQNSGQRAH